MSGYQPEGEGAHPTMAGNVLDPNVSADGQKSGRGVGGTSESTIKDEATEHINSRGGQGQTSGQGYGTSSINTGEPSAIQQHDQGIDHVKSASGIGSGQGNSTDRSGGIVDDYGARSAGETGLGSGATSGLDRQNDTYNSQSSSQSGNTSGSTYNDSTSAQSGGHNRSLDPMNNTDAGTQQPTDSNVRTGGDPAAADTVGGQTSQDQSSSGSGITGTAHDGKQPTEAEAANDGDGKGGPPASIPLAGGERIGTKHWGESKVIPDNPARQPSENVSSKDGQSDDLTKKNTDSNTGSAEDGTGKESMMDKIKDKLHMSK